MSKNFILASATLFGTIVGAGIFALPYVVSKSGVLISAFYFILLGLVVLALHLFLAEIVLKTKAKRRLAGYAEQYLGKKAKHLAGLTVILGTTGALLVYIILGSSFLQIIFPYFSFWKIAVVSWAFLSFFVLLGIKSVASFEALLNLGLFLVLMIIFGLTAPKISLDNFKIADGGYLFLPFGIVLFSLIGWSAVPEIAGFFKKENGKSLKWAIIFTVVLALFLSLVFALVVSGVSGQNTNQEPFSALQDILGRKIIILGALFGLLSVATSFLVLANYLKNTLWLDYHLPLFLSFVLACLPCLVLFLAGVRSLVKVMSVVGAFVGLIEGAFIIFIYQKIKQKKLIPYLLLAVLIAGAFSQFIYLFFLA